MKKHRHPKEISAPDDETFSPLILSNRGGRHLEQKTHFEMDEVLLPHSNEKMTSRSDVADWRIRLSFWIIGLCNGAVYVIMVAGAKEINSGGVGLVFFCDVAPGFLVKLTAPYWFHIVPHGTRTVIGVILMILAFSMQSSLGEATFLSLTARYDSRWALTMWSSGTGMAGVFGFGYVYVFNILLGFSFKKTLLVANFLGPVLLATFFWLLGPIPPQFSASLKEQNDFDSFEMLIQNESTSFKSRNSFRENDVDYFINGDRVNIIKEEKKKMTFRDRLTFVLSLWPYMLPLGLVYLAEYCMQSGTWGAIGFPVSSEEARKKFYLYANWMYQVGVFISRSSALIFLPSRITLQVVMPCLQVLLLFFFYIDAVYQFWYNYYLLLLCVVAGLLGGAVYVGTFIILANDTVADKKELALGAASIADTIGICFADIFGLYIQSCLYKSNDVPGATVRCPF